MNLHRNNGATGFSLVELMITLAIISIVSAIAYPSYRENVRRGNRVEARALMLENAQYMERFFTENNSYLQTAGALPVAPVLPNLVSPRGASETKANYKISFSPASPRTMTTFEIQAEPVNGMATDDCKTFTYNHLGQKGTVGTLSGGMTTETCWSK